MRRLGAWLWGGRASPPDAPRPAGAEDPDTWIGLDFVFEQVRAQLERQQKLWDEADSRLRLILGVIGIVFAVTLGLLPRGAITSSTAGGAPSITPLLLPFAVGALAILGLALFAVAGSISVAAYWPREFSWPPAPDALRRYVTTDQRQIKLTLLDELLDAYATNNRWLGRKFTAFRWALVITGMATAALGASVIIELAQLTRPLT